MLNQVSAALTDAEKTDIIDSIKHIDSKLTFARTISTTEVGAKQNLGDSLDFVLKGINAIKVRPDIMPSAFVPAEYFKDNELYADLYEIQTTLSALMQKIEGTMTLLGQDMMENSNEVYFQLQRGVKSDPSLQTLLDEMKKFYAKTKKTEPKAKPSTT